MHPIVVLGGAALLGLAAYEVFKPKAQVSEGPLGLGTKELQQGKTYAVQLQILSNQTGTNDIAKMSNVIKATFEQLGWSVSSPPATRDPSEAAHFIAGEASQWMFTGVWMRPETSMSQGPPWLGMAVAFQLPVA